MRYPLCCQVSRTANMHIKNCQPETAPYVPTPEDIRRECLAIQATWGDAERLRRAGLHPGRLELWPINCDGPLKGLAHPGE